MTRLNEVPSQDNAVTLLLYGNSGTGKTFFIGSAGDRSLVITPRHGFATLQSKKFKDTYKVNPFIEVIDFPDKSSSETYDRYCDIIDTYLEKHLDEIDTIVVDDATSFRRAAMDKGLELGGKFNTSKTKSKMDAIKTDLVVPAVQDFGMEMKLVEKFVRGTADLCKQHGKNFIMTAHERNVFEKGPNIGDMPTLRKVSPGFTGQTFPDEITGLFDLTWHTSTQGSGDRIFYQIQTQPDSVVIAKTRWGGLFPVKFETQPKFTDVVNAVKTQTLLGRK